ncbi:MAG: Flp pilus assembly protein CpaB [Armatimonadetes bacterium]|nr:Flp pilus assembly protein CpaB [Armatimonadota bacterium]
MNIRPLAIVALAVLIIALVAFAFLRNRQGQQKQQQQAQQIPTTPIPVAGHDIPQGQQVTDQDVQILQKKQEEVAELPQDAMKDPQEFLGGQALVTIAKGGYFTKTNILPPPATVAGKVETGYVGLVVRTPEAPSLYDLKFLEPDQRVDVFGIQADQQAKNVSSIRLASNVRILAVNKVFDNFKEQQRVKKLRAEIDALKEEKQRLLKQPGAPPSAETLKAKDDEIAKKEAEIDPVYKDPSVTLEVTYDQAQKIALWKQAAKLDLALHREVDADTAINDPGLRGVLMAGAGGSPTLVAPSSPLTLDDVLPLEKRDPAGYADRVKMNDDVRRRASEDRLRQLEDRAKAKELEIELRNLSRYGERTRPQRPTRMATPVVPPVMVSRGGDAEQWKRKYEQQAAENRDLKRRAQAAAPTQSIEIIRGTQRSTVEY